MKANKKAIIVVVLLLLVGVTSGYVANSYAKYAEEITGNEGTAHVAAWAFATDNASQTIDMDLTNTVVASSLSSDRVAPGTEGEFTLALTNENTEVGVDFTVSFATTNLPTNLTLYKTRTGSAGSYVYSDPITAGTTTITGQLAAEYVGPLDVPVYWQWPLGSSDAVDNSINEDDTDDGIAHQDLTVSVTITGVQRNPATATTTGVN